MKTKAVRTILHLVTEPTLGELLLGFNASAIAEITRSYGLKASRSRLENVARLLEIREALHGNIRISIHPPKRQKR